MKRSLTSMTEGSPARLLISFALPLIFANVFQQLYTVTDTAIVGQGVGLHALAAVGAADWFHWMLLSTVQGICAGFAVRFSQQFGARDESGLRRTIASAAVLSVLLTLVLTAASQLLVYPVLHLLDTPPEIIGGAATYLRVMFLGLPLTMLANFTASLLRSLGDSRTPLYGTIFASLLNVVLDLLFVFPFRWGIAGAAFASVIAQGASALVNLIRLRGLSIVRLQRSDFDGWQKLVFPLLRLGVPIASMNAITAVGGMGVQSVVNRFGATVIAGFTATNKLYGLLEIASMSYGYAISTYTGQNFGAGDFGRIRRGVRAAVCLSLGTATVLGLLIYWNRAALTGLFISSTDPAEAAAALAISTRYLALMCSWLSALYLIFVYRSALQGMGQVIVPMLSGALETVIRIGSVFLLVSFWSDAIYYAEVFAWAGAALFNAAGYYVLVHRWKHNQT